MDGVQDLWEGEYTCRCIQTNDYDSSAREILEFNNLRGGNSTFSLSQMSRIKLALIMPWRENEGWNPTCLRWYKQWFRAGLIAQIQRLDAERFGLNATSRIKALVFRFVSVPAMWIRTSRRYVLNLGRIQAVLLTLPMKYYSYRQRSSTSIAHAVLLLLLTLLILTPNKYKTPFTPVG